jgi:Ca2+-binding RTX toxin-like protein
MLIGILQTTGASEGAFRSEERSEDETAGDDRLRGSNGSDALIGLGGNDILLGLRGADAMSGGDGRDAVLGGNERGPKSGDKSLDGGGRGADAMNGGAGPDYLFAGPPNEGASDVDAITAGSGNDAIFARNVPAARDVIDCGGGFDRVLVDSKDITTGCERTFTSFNRFFNAIPDSYFAPLNNL